MNTGKKYCTHYRNLAKRQEIVKRKNDRWGYEKYEPPQDNSNCDNCDKHPMVLPFKVCFRLRFKWRLYYCFWEKDFDNAKYKATLVFQEEGKEDGKTEAK